MTYQRRNLLMLIAILVVGIMAYKLSIKKTIESYQNHKTLSKNLEKVTYFSDSMQFLNKEFAMKEKTLSINHDTADHFQINILNILTENASNRSLSVINILQGEHFPYSGFTVDQYVVEVRGNFRDILLFTDDIEQKRLCRISSVDFRRNKDFDSGKLFLTAKLVLQSIIIKS